MESVGFLAIFLFKNRRSLQPRVLCSSRNKDCTYRTTRMLSKRGICLCFMVLWPRGRSYRWRCNRIDRKWRKIITCILKHVGFTLLCHYVKFCFFFQFDPQTLFLGDQVIFKEQLISNSYEMVGLEDGG